jgi:hypothetical protein
MLLPNSKLPGNFGRPRSPTAKELALKEVALRNALKRDKPSSKASPRQNNYRDGTHEETSAYALVEQYRRLTDPREVSEFWRKNKSVLANSKLHELVKVRIASGKRLEGFVLTLLATRTEKQP